VRRYRALAHTGKRPPHFSQLGTPEHQEEWSFSLGPPNFSQMAITKPGCVRALGEALPNFSQSPTLLLTDNRPISHRTRPTFSHSVGIIVYDQRLNERLRRGGRKQRLGLEAPNYLVVGIRESVLEETTVTPLRPGLIDALILAGLAFRPPRALILSRNSAWE
jgi:hypothetical protein